MKGVRVTDAGYAPLGKATARAILESIPDRGTDKR
jgi:hypothetical protein